jgi:quercetin dioxygenase-like cupin family protein
MSTKRLVVKPGDRSPALSVLGVNVTVLVSDADSHVQQITHQSGDEGAGPPPHSHDWDESFYVIKGQVQFNCDGQTTTCLSGTLVHLPAGTIHAFSFGPGGGEMLEITGVGSNARFRQVRLTSPKWSKWPASTGLHFTSDAICRPTNACSRRPRQSSKLHAQICRLPGGLLNSVVRRHWRCLLALLASKAHK